MKKYLAFLLGFGIAACTPSTFIDAPSYPLQIELGEEAQVVEQKLQQFAPDLEKITLPEGFEISVYAAGVDGARSLTLSDDGQTVFVGSRQAGKVYALQDQDKNGKADAFYTIDSGLNSPNGVAFREGALYVAEISRILRYDDILTQLENPPEPIVVKDDLPSDTHHGWKFIAFGPDDKLYVPIGAPCNICESSPEYAAIHRMNPDGSDFETIASGVRNTVGFAWHPETQELWFTENGGDWLGDDQPVDELNNVTQLGEHFGYPYCHAGNLLDPDYGVGKNCDEYTAPEQALGPHVAALGMRFYTGTQFPKEYQNQIFIAEHGSWNRTNKIGYRVSLVRLENGEAVAYEPFAEGWLQGQSAWGRPVDVQVLPDGSLLISDDYAEAIYRISYSQTP